MTAETIDLLMRELGNNCGSCTETGFEDELGSLSDLCKESKMVPNVVAKLLLASTVFGPTASLMAAFVAGVGLGRRIAVEEALEKQGVQSQSE